MKAWSNLAKVVYKRTYSRNDNGISENWKDTVDRVISGNVNNFNISKEEKNKLFNLLINRKAMPAGRGLWFSGTSAHKKLGGAALNNCWGLVADDWRNFVMAQDLSMLGGGVGMSVENKYTSKLPKVRKDVSIINKETKDADFIVPDSREGWNQLSERIFESFFVTGKSFSYSTVCLRGAGEPISGFGGKASGPLPIHTFVQKISNIFKIREGKYIRPIDASDILCCIGELVVSGNVRRSALLILGDPWDKEYLKAKRWDLGSIPSQRAMANFSVNCSDFDDLHPLFWQTYEHGEAFGIVNIKNANKYGRMGELKKDNVQIFNPCFSEDTLIAVADGRGAVKIKDLVSEGKDISVYSLDHKTGKVAIKLGRNPRVTGYEKKLLRVVLDDDTFLDVTPEHKFPLRSGETKEAKDLISGDSLFRLTKRPEQITKENKNKYIRVYCDAINSKIDKIFEHRLIARFYNKNKWQQKYDLNKKDGWFKSVSDLLIWAAIECNVSKDLIDADPRTAKLYQEAICQGYEAQIKNHTVCINKNCEMCDKKFETTWNRREVCFCSTSCSNKRPQSIVNRNISLNKLYNEKQKETHHKQIMIFKDLQDDLSREPFKKEWEETCKEKNIPFRLASGTQNNAYKNNVYAFSSFADLKEKSANYNHRVKKIIELDGEHTVYNITVDDFHTVGIVTDFEVDTQSCSGVYVFQCGEASLENGEPCNLQDIFLPNLESEQEFFEAARLMHRWGKRVTCENYHNEKNDSVVKRNRRVGTGITGCLQSRFFNIKILDKAYLEIQKENINYSKDLGIPESIRTTVVKPSGTLSLLGDSTPGIHPSFSKYYIRRVRFAANDDLISALRTAGHYMEPVQRFDGSLDLNTLVADFYCETEDGTPCADEGFDTWKQLETLKLAQKHWADQAVSVTVYYKKEEIYKIKEWIKENLNELKSISFLCHNEHGFKQAPLEAISKEVYEQNKKVKNIDMENISDGDIESMECESGVCPVK